MPAHPEPIDPPTTRAAKRFLPLQLALASMAILWLAMPPVGWSWLAWIAPVPLVWLIRKTDDPPRVYRQLWIAGFAYWLATLYFVPIPFWGLVFGWLLLSFYLSLYLPLFIAMARVMHHRWRWPIVIAAPIAWTGLEVIRTTFATGFGMMLLSHSQYHQPGVVQLASGCGAYGVSFLLMMFAAVVGTFTLPGTTTSPRSRETTWSLGVAGMFVLVIGAFVLLPEPRGDSPSDQSDKTIRVALIQSSIDTVLRPPTEQEFQQWFEHRQQLTLEARRQRPDLDLIVWPESSFGFVDMLSDSDAVNTAARFRESQRMGWAAASGVGEFSSNAVPLMVGTTTADPANETVYNSTVLFGAGGDVEARYYKNHRVMFGEYFPLLGSIPVVKNFIQGFSTINAGTEFESMRVADFNVAPNICFETTVPHLIRRQVNHLSQAGNEPDVLVNLTNDGWFYGTSCLDFHLACNVFRAAEMGKPMLVCANTGFSAHINPSGKILQQGPRRQPAVLQCDVISVESDVTIYRRWGAWLPWFASIVCVIAAVWMMVARRS